MRVVPDWQEMNSVLRVIVTSSFVGFLLALIFVACNDEYYFGKQGKNWQGKCFC